VKLNDIPCQCSMSHSPDNSVIIVHSRQWISPVKTSQ